MQGMVNLGKSILKFHVSTNSHAALCHFHTIIFFYRRRSCSGWNIWSVVLDFAGGFLSLLQLVGDAIDLDDYSSITGNIPKLGLSLISMTFDVSNTQFYILSGSIITYSPKPTRRLYSSCNITFVIET